MHKVTVSKLAKPYHDGDWHDPMLKWSAIGPGNEVQNFNTKANAMAYAKIRRNAVSLQAASRAYLNS